MALRQGRAAPAPAVHGELVVEAVGEAVAGAHVAGGHCSCWLLLSRATVGTWKYIFTLFTWRPWAGWVGVDGSWCWAGSQGPGGQDRELEMWPGGWLGATWSASSPSISQLELVTKLHEVFTPG